MSAKEHLEELLSGFLDGKLTADELQEVQAAMAADATLGNHLQQLKQIGNDLRSIPQRRLPADFSKRVLAAVQVEAAANGSSAAGYVTPAKPAGTHTGMRTWQRTGAGLAVVAATLVFAAYLSGWLPSGFQKADSQGQQFVQGTNQGSSVGETEQLDSPALNVPGLDMPALPDVEIDAGAVVRNEIQRQGSNELGIEFLPVFEVQPVMEVWQSDAIASLLRNAGIEWSSPVTASSDLIGALNDTRSISRGIGDGDGDQVALVLVRASGLKVEKVMLDLWAKEKEYPHVFMDIAFDIPGKELVRKLTDAQRLAFNQKTAIATPIVVSSGDGVDVAGASQFSAAPTDRYVAKSARSKPLAFGTPVTSKDENELTYLLLVIRKPAE